MELNKIYLNDCIEQMKEIDDKSIDMILCDPPYGVTAQTWDKLISFEKMWEQYKRIIKKDGIICLFSSQPFTTLLISSNIKNFKYCWYWQKNQGTNFFHAKRMPIRKIEEICIFGGKKYNPQITTGHIPTNSAKGCSNGKIYFGDNKRNYVGGSTERFPTNILEFKCVNNYSKLHPNEKPVALLEYLIKTYTNENEIVLDNCIGSGSTAIACLNTNRNFIGIEKDEGYFELANKRIKEHISNQNKSNNLKKFLSQSKDVDEDVKEDFMEEIKKIKFKTTKEVFEYCDTNNIENGKYNILMDYDKENNEYYFRLIDKNTSKTS